MLIGYEKILFLRTFWKSIFAFRKDASKPLPWN